MNPTKKIKAIPGSGGEAELEAEKEKTELFKLLEVEVRKLQLEAEKKAAEELGAEKAEMALEILKRKMEEEKKCLLQLQGEAGEVTAERGLLRCLLLLLPRLESLEKTVLEILERKKWEMKKCILLWYILQLHGEAGEVTADRDELLEILSRKMGETGKCILQLQQEAGEVAAPRKELEE